MTEPHSVHSNELPPELRGLGLLIALDALVGIWLALHDPGALSAYLAPQLPAVGIGGLAWGFLPKEPKDKFGEWLARHLARPAFSWSVVVVACIGLVASGAVSALSVRSVDSQISTQIRAVQGNRERPDSAALADARAKRLNRVTTPIRWFLIGFLTGTPVWLYSDTLVSGDHRTKPWFPVAIDYPDDFEEMVTIAVLPDDYALAKLSADTATFRLFDLSGGVSQPIGRGVLGEHATFVSFTRPRVPGSVELGRWRALLMEHNRADTLAVPHVLKKWLSAESSNRWIGTTRPLVLGQSVSWEVISSSQKELKKGKMTLNDHVADLPLSF